MTAKLKFWVGTTAQEIDQIFDRLVAAAIQNGAKNCLPARGGDHPGNKFNEGESANDMYLLLCVYRVTK
jgi:hypothetical protein